MRSRRTRFISSYFLADCTCRTDSVYVPICNQTGQHSLVQTDINLALKKRAYYSELKRRQTQQFLHLHCVQVKITAKTYSFQFLRHLASHCSNNQFGWYSVVKQRKNNLRREKSTDFSDVSIPVLGSSTSAVQFPLPNFLFSSLLNPSWVKTFPLTLYSHKFSVLPLSFNVKKPPLRTEQTLKGTKAPGLLWNHSDTPGEDKAFQHTVTWKVQNFVRKFQ
jgi:hypothetical protein